MAAMTKEDPSQSYNNDDLASDSSTHAGAEEPSESDAAHGVKQSDAQGKEAKKQEAELLDMVKRENKAVFGLRIILTVCLLVSAIVCSVLVYMYSSNEENKAYEAQFDSDAEKLFESIGTNFDLTMGAADAFMFQIISQSKSTNSVWPFVTIPDLPQKTAKLISQTDAIYMAFYPLISGDKRSQWENFTKDNDSWVKDSLEVQSRNPGFHGPIIEEYPISNAIWNNEGPESYDNSGPFLPSWMGSPVIPYYYPYNWNALAYEAFSKGLVTCMETFSVVVTAVANNADPSNPEAVAQAATTSDWAIPYLDPDEDSNEPFSDMYYPVVDAIDDVLINVTNETKALGSVAFSFYWRHALKDALPPNSKGVIIVFENECGNQVFTYQIDGKTPIFLGFADLHDPQFDDKALSKKLTELINRNDIYSGLPMNDQFCPYILTIYPSVELQAVFVTNDPTIYAVMIALIFLLTSIVFFWYDWFVNRRQALIKERALASGAIVSSLFPEQVRDQLYHTQADDTAKNNAAASKSQFRASTTEKDMMTNQSSFGGNLTGRPNAHLYEGTSVFFADLVGFTKWSSTRTPEEVFVLLETVYGAFDKLAARRGVFKVETIGDCYVAATGIPDPQPLHAVIMVKFAHDCLERIHILTQDLASKLGDDTMDLTMRVGINSGSTTAGVLRGEKGRFQLFGDTVNTAARMESTGVKNRIQVSQATADELIKAGKGNWLIKRKETVTPKGKGEMTTYFVTVKRPKNTNSSATSDPTTFKGGNSSVTSDPMGASFSSDNKRRRSTTTIDVLPSLLDTDIEV